MLMDLTRKLASLATALVRSLLSRSGLRCLPSPHACSAGAASQPRLTPALLASLATSPATRFARLACSARFARTSLVLCSLPSPLACCSLRSPLACCSLRSPPRLLLSLRSPPRLRLLASLATTPVAARFARRFACGCSLRSRAHLLASLLTVPSAGTLAGVTEA